LKRTLLLAAPLDVHRGMERAECFEIRRRNPSRACPSLSLGP
jgi:hypothetical protein